MVKGFVCGDKLAHFITHSKYTLLNKWAVSPKILPFLRFLSFSFIPVCFIPFLKFLLGSSQHSVHEYFAPHLNKSGLNVSASFEPNCTKQKM
jgi:hypothetical protein